MSSALAIEPKEKANGVVALGDRVLALLDGVGGFGLLALQTVGAAARRGFPLREVAVQFEAIAVRSLSIVSVTALFSASMSLKGT